MNLHLLRTFASVVALGGFTRAAEAIHISQPAVSRAVKELEDQFGMPLIERGSSPIQCTEAGLILYRHAQAIFALEQAAEAELRSLRGLEHGSLVVGASRTIATYMLPQLIARYLEMHPNIAVRTVSDNTHSIEQRLLSYELDVALVEGPIHNDRIELLDWREDEMVILVSANQLSTNRQPMTTERLSNMRWIMRETGSGTRDVAQRLLHEAGIEVRRMLEVGSNGAVVQCVAAGVGITMISLEAARDQLDLGRVMAIELPGFRPRRPLYRAKVRDRPVSAAAKAFDAIACLAPE